MAKNIFVTIAYLVLFVLQTLVQLNQLKDGDTMVCDDKGRCTCNVRLSKSDELLLKDSGSDQNLKESNAGYNMTQLIARKRTTGKPARKILPQRNQTNRMFDN